MVDQLYYNLNYKNVITYEPGSGKTKRNKVGVVSHTNTKYRCVMNMRYFVNECRCVNIRDLQTLIEVKNFIKYPNGKWAARPGVGELDDRVMSLGWALLVLDNDIVKNYYDVIRYDDNNRPAQLKRYDFDYGLKVEKKMFGWGDDDGNEVDPLLFNEKYSNDSNSELDFLKSSGWVPASDFQTQRSYTPAANSGLF